MHIEINQKSVYGPIRYEATRPYAVALGRLHMAHFKQGASSRLRFVHQVLPDMLRSAMKKLGRPQGPGPGQAEHVNVQVFGQFMDAGKVIFDVAQPLSQCLLLTDADDIPCGEIFLPCPAFYLHFGQASGLSGDEVSIEGVFISGDSNALMMDLVPKGFGSPFFISSIEGEPLIHARVDLQDPSMPATLALEQSVRMIQRQRDNALALHKEQEALLEAQYGQIVKAPSPVESLDKHLPLIRKALGLILNTLFYLSAEPEDVIEQWSQDVPGEALETIRTTDKTGTRNTIENTLKKAGYTKVRYIGHMFTASKTGNDFKDAVSEGHTIATHFRRGHFRRQPHGPQRSLRKTIFVAPVLVNAGKGEPAGRVYEVVTDPKVRSL